MWVGPINDISSMNIQIRSFTMPYQPPALDHGVPGETQSAVGRALRAVLRQGEIKGGCRGRKERATWPARPPARYAAVTYLFEGNCDEAAGLSEQAQERQAGGGGMAGARGMAGLQLAIAVRSAGRGPHRRVASRAAVGHLVHQYQHTHRSSA